ncbi:MAG: AraC family transcriptional regulator [Alphaproteobacteria bacterium]|nr:AraC family transcriptional regulator [Alphaproteobacteria bacterium]
MSDVFSTLKLMSGIYFRTDLTGAFAIEVPTERRRIRFHLVRHGACWARVQGMQDWRRLTEGDLAIIPNGAAQILADSPERKPVPIGDIIRSGAVDDTGVLSYGQGDGRVQLLCGYCAFDEDIDHPLIASLPDMIVLAPRDLGGEPWATATLRLLSLEADLGAQGMRGILSRLLEIVFIQAVRRMKTDQVGAEVGYISALADAHLSKALLAIHTSPHLPWTIAELARSAGMSRAQFAEKFTSTVGVPPISYLTSWRLSKARRLLRETDLATDEIARRCGYASLPSFTRRFKTAFDVGPGAFRRGREP